MAIRYYKKLFPANKVRLGENQDKGVIEFSTPDGLVGYFATDQEYVQQEFERFAREQRYGIQEIQADEFHRDYVQKKTQNPQETKVWREEIGSKLGARGLGGTEPVVRLGSERVQAAVGVSGKSDIPKSRLEQTAMENLPPSQPAKAPMPDKPVTFTPNTGQRTRKNK